MGPSMLPHAVRRGGRGEEAARERGWAHRHGWRRAGGCATLNSTVKVDRDSALTFVGVIGLWSGLDACTLPSPTSTDSATPDAAPRYDTECSRAGGVCINPAPDPTPGRKGTTGLSCELMGHRTAVPLSCASPGRLCCLAVTPPPPRPACLATNVGREFTEADLVDDLGGTFAPPRPPQHACTDAELTLLQSNLYAKVDDERLRAGLSATCASCAISRIDDAQWGPIVVSPTKRFVNYGACGAHVSGSVVCGRAFAMEAVCVARVCDAACGVDAVGCAAYARSDRGRCHTSRVAREAACPAVDACVQGIHSLLQYFCGP